MAEADEELPRALQARLSRLADDASPELDELGRRRVLSAVRVEADHLEREGRLARLAEEASPALSDEGRRRVLDAVISEAQPSEGQRPEAQPANVEGGARGPGARRWVAFGAVALAAAAALLLFFGRDVESTAPAEVASPPEVASRACEGWAPASGETIGRRGSALGIGEHRVVGRDGCTTDIYLDRGEVGVHARDLGGGVLRVHAGPVAVEVRGTRFVVTRSASRVGVSVSEGHVVVSVGAEPEVHLRAGDSWERRAPESASAEPTPSPPVATAVEPSVPLAAPAVDPDPRPRAAPRRDRTPRGEREPAEPAPPTAAEELARANRLWREGDRSEARVLFRRVGAGAGPVAEAAWVRLARLELRGGDARAARQAARRHRSRFATGRLSAEALFLLVQSSDQLGDQAGASSARAELQRRFPGSPQARSVESHE